MVTERDILILRALAQYFVLNRQQIQRLIFPEDKNGRITRRRLQLLVDAHFINRQNMLYCYPGIAPAPVYYPSQKGCDFLAEHDEDDRVRLSPTHSPLPQHILHWLAISDTHIALNEAIGRQNRVSVDCWINEWEVVNKEENRPEKRFQLYSLLSESPRLVCAPDAAFLLNADSHRKVFYLEQDRGTSGIHQVAGGKCKGYVALAERRLHLRHFPQATIDQFSVLLIAPNPKRRELLRKAFMDKPGREFWRFAAAEDITPERLLYEPIFHSCDGEVRPLLKRP